MSQPYYPLSEICQAAIVIDLESREIWDYSMIERKPIVHGLYRPNPPTNTFLIYWPGGLFAYVVCKYTLEQLEPNFIEDVHAAAKLLKPVTSHWKVRM
jgi:hypothetical protein